MAARKKRSFPRDTLEESLAVPQKIMDEMAGKPFRRLLLADALGISPGSSNFRYLLSSSHQYGLTEGTEKATDVELTDLGRAATQTADAAKRIGALRQAATTPDVFGRFYRDYRDKRMPSSEMLGKILGAEYAVPENLTQECAQLIVDNGRFTGILRDIQGSPHVVFDAPVSSPEAIRALRESSQEAPTPLDEGVEETALKRVGEERVPDLGGPGEKPRPIFIGHGKNKKPLEKLQKLLSTFQIPYKVTTEEPNLGRPIPQKVRETMLQCGSAILIFTRDEKLFDENDNEVWRPSENVVHELGAASLLYEDRIVIFKENGLHLPTNFQSIGYIEFDVDAIDGKTADLLKELVGFGLVRVTPI